MPGWIERIVSSRTPGEAIVLIVAMVITAGATAFGGKAIEIFGNQEHATRGQLEAVAATARRAEAMADHNRAQLVQLTEGVEAAATSSTETRRLYIETELFKSRLAACQATTSPERAALNAQVQQLLAQWRAVNAPGTVYTMLKCEDIR